MVKKHLKQKQLNKIAEFDAKLQKKQFAKYCLFKDIIYFANCFLFKNYNDNNICGEKMDMLSNAAVSKS